jgi:hypothetical protein
MKGMIKLATATLRKFVSKYKDHKLVMVPTRRVIEDGMSYSKPGKAIQFTDHVFETSDKDEIAFITKHRLFGVDIVEEKTAEPKE